VDGRIAVLDQEVEHGGDQHAADAERRGLGGRVQPRHDLGQLDEPERADQQEEATHNDQCRDQQLDQIGRHRSAPYSMMSPRRTNLQ
jgi:hypothetical protein